MTIVKYKVVRYKVTLEIELSGELEMSADEIFGRGPDHDSASYAIDEAVHQGEYSFKPIDERVEEADDLRGRVRV